MIKIDEKQEFRKMMEDMIGKYYDLEVVKNKTCLAYMNNFNRNSIVEVRARKYSHVQLVNINGMGIGQVHFITDDGSYLLLPWCYVISMIPSED